jgi:hypothetical protein
VNPRFNGSEYRADLDDARLTRQLERVRGLMLDGQWRTLAEIESRTGDPAASVSAQLRHLRKERFGSWIVEKRSRGERCAGYFEYRLLPPRENKGGQFSTSEKHLSIQDVSGLEIKTSPKADTKAALRAEVARLRAELAALKGAA